MAKRLLIAGLIATIVGSFLPWVYSGDAVIQAENGIRIMLTSASSAQARSLLPAVEDHGGAAVLLLSLALGLAFLPRSGSERGLGLWTLLDAVALVLLSGLHIADVFARRAHWQGPGAPTVGIGLVLVAVGSVVVMAASWRLHQSPPPEQG